MELKKLLEGGEINMNKLTKVMVIGGVLGSMVLPLGSSSLISSADAATSRTSTWDRDWRGRWYDRDHRRDYHRVVVVDERDHGRHHRHHKFIKPKIHRDHRYVYPKIIIIINRDDDRRYFRLSNYLTGPYSYNSNVAYIRVSDDFYNRIRSNIDVSNEIDLDVNTGNNTVSFNTFVGSVTTGDVDIDIR